MNFKTYAILGVVKSMSMKKDSVNTQLVFTLIKKKKILSYPKPLF